MFREHPNAHITVLPARRPKNYRRQRIGRAKRHAVSVKLDTVYNTEAIIWLQVR